MLPNALADWVAHDVRLLAMIGTGDQVPTAEDLAAAPVLSQWEVVVYGREPLPSLGGQVTGHSRLADGTCVTSNIMAADPIAGWVRTRNTLYALGQHKHERIN